MNPIDLRSSYDSENIEFEFSCDPVLEISPEFMNEIKTHICNDASNLHSTFNLSATISKVYIEPTLGETHFIGKKTVFLTLETHDGQKHRLVYKPRSVLPEKYLEECLFSIHRKPLRPILDCGKYGYDTFIKENIFHKKKHNDNLMNFLLKASKKNENRILITVLYQAKIEDIHLDNFIIDDDGLLHFIDAEVFQTNYTSNINNIYKNKKFKKIADLEENLHIDKLIELLSNIPSRLVIFSSNQYAYDDKSKLKVKIGDKIFENCTFEDHQFLSLTKYLIKNNLLILNCINEEITIENIKLEVNNIFEEDNIYGRMSVELAKIQHCQKYGIKKELPLFYIHKKENWIEFPITEVKIKLKNQDR